MKKIVSLLLTVLLFLSFTPNSFASSLDLDVNFTNHEENYSEAAIQLQQLNELGYIDEFVTEQDLIEESHESLNTTSDEDILSEGAYLVGIDTTTNEVYDIDEFIEERSLFNDISSNVDSVSNRSSSSVSNKSSLLVYSVAFKTWITDPGTTTSKINHSVEVTGVYGIGTRPNNYSIIARIQRATSERGSYIDAVNETKTVAFKKAVTISTYINSTYYWKSDSMAYANYPNISYSADAKNEGPWLLNKKGMKYPEYSDPKSKKIMSKPASTTWSAVSNSSCALTTSDRTAYRAWYDKNHGTLNWDDYEIHHIRPCKWGVNKDYSNLIPLPSSFHRGTVSPWWVNY